MDQIFSNPDVLRVLMTVAAGTTITAFIALAATLGAAISVKQVRLAREYWTRAYPTIRAQVDERTDAIPTAIDRVLDKRIRPEDYDAAVSAYLLALLDGINKRAMIEPPAQEISIGGVSK